LRELAKSTDPDAAGGGVRSRDRATAGTRSSTTEEQRPLEAIQPKAARAEPQAKPAPAPGSLAGVASAMRGVSPELWLEQIAELRKHGKHEEADKALAEFRKRYPDYRISDEVKAKVEKK
jgi:hypothetical protein